MTRLVLHHVHESANYHGCLILRTNVFMNLELYLEKIFVVQEAEYETQLLLRNGPWPLLALSSFQNLTSHCVSFLGLP